MPVLGPNIVLGAHARGKGAGVSDLSLLAKYAPTGAGAFLFNFGRTDRTFQDAAGATIADDAGEPVGLALDAAPWGGKTYAEMLAAQTELRSSGVTGSIGSPAAAATYNTVTGDGTVFRTASGDQSFVTVPVSVGETYRVEVTNTGATTLLVRDGGHLAGTLMSISAGVSQVRYVTPTGGSGQLYLVSSGGEATFTLTSAKRIPGNHAYQSDSTSYRGLRQSDGSILLDGADDYWRTPLLLGAAGTMAVDFNVSSTDGADGDALMGNFTTSGSKGGSCGINQLGQIFAGVGSLSSLVCKGTNNVLGQRTTLIFAYGGGQAALYENEVQVFSSAQGGTPTTEAITLGALGVNGTPNLAYCTAGKMYNAMVLPAAITAAEAAALSRQWRNT